jgi:hypothetical protein
MPLGRQQAVRPAPIRPLGQELDRRGGKGLSPLKQGSSLLCTPGPDREVSRWMDWCRRGTAGRTDLLPSTYQQAPCRMEVELLMAMIVVIVYPRPQLHPVGRSSCKSNPRRYSRCGSFLPAAFERPGGNSLEYQPVILIRSAPRDRVRCRDGWDGPAWVGHACGK